MGILIAYLLGILSAVQSKNDNRRPVNNETSKDRKSFPVPLPVINMPPAPSDQERAKQEKKDSRDKWKFRFEVAGLIVLTVYAGFTIGIWYANKKAGDAAQQAIAIANEHFQKDQRPYIWYTFVDPFPFEPNKQLKANIYIANYGKTPAIRQIGSGAIFYGADAIQKADAWFDGLASQPYSNRGSVNIVPPGIPTNHKDGLFMTAVSDQIPKDKDIAYIEKHDSGALLVMRAEYFDTAGNYYVSDMCFTRLQNGVIGHCHTHNVIN